MKFYSHGSLYTAFLVLRGYAVSSWIYGATIVAQLQPVDFSGTLSECRSERQISSEGKYGKGSVPANCEKSSYGYVEFFSIVLAEKKGSLGRVNGDDRLGGRGVAVLIAVACFTQDTLLNIDFFVRSLVLVLQESKARHQRTLLNESQRFESIDKSTHPARAPRIAVLHTAIGATVQDILEGIYQMTKLPLVSLRPICHITRMVLSGTWVQIRSIYP